MNIVAVSIRNNGHTCFAALRYDGQRFRASSTEHPNRALRNIAEQVKQWTGANRVDYQPGPIPLENAISSAFFRIEF